jgi:hypothetical protein
MDAAMNECGCTHAGFDIHRAQAPCGVEQQRHVGGEKPFGWVHAVVGRRLHKLKVFQLHFQLFLFGALSNNHQQLGVCFEH